MHRCRAKQQPEGVSWDLRGQRELQQHNHPQRRFRRQIGFELVQGVIGSQPADGSSAEEFADP